MKTLKQRNFNHGVVIGVLVMCVLILTVLGCSSDGGSVLDTAATPVATPPEGTYDSAQSVTIATTTAGASVYYTVDGSTPTAGSTLYSDPVSISETTTLKAIAVKEGMNNSGVLTAVYTIEIPPDSVAAPTADPPARIYGEAQSVTLATTTEGASIYYTIDGSTPTTSSTLYSSPIDISESKTIKAIAVKEGMTNSSVLNAQYTIIIGAKVIYSSADSGTGSLRNAITNAQDGDLIIMSGVTSIGLASQLSVSKNVTIDGNGAVITKGASFTSTNSLLSINSGKTVSISCVHFKDGKASSGGAIINYGTLTLESCIFSGNQATSAGGGIYNSSSSVTVKGCTFYNNSAGTFGGAAIYNGSGATLALTGNLFYGNTSSTYPAVAKYGTITSGGYNVVDVELGNTKDTQSGWTSATGDKTISIPPVSGKTFKLLSDSGAKNVITTLPSEYPTKDFYGNTIANGAASGAVQASVSGSGYYLELSINNTQAGTVNISPAPNEDGLCSGTTTLTATAQSGYSFAYWMVNGVKQTGSPLTVTSQAKVAAVFTRTITVTSNADTNTSGTLRYAISNAQDGDIISLSGVSTIELTSRLDISKNVTIEGNGAVFTKSASFTSTNSLLQTGDSTEVNISRVHFKGGRGSYGGAISNSGTLTVESCIFSDNQATSAGGGIYNSSSSVTVKGCTFYNNSGGTYGGGAIYIGIGATLTMTGNLFYINTADTYPVIFGNYVGTITSGGYNVVNVTLGTGNDQSGWTSVTSDKTFSALGISSAPFNTATFVPVAGLRSVMPSTAIAGFPTTDFNGETRTWPGAPGAVK